MKVFISFVSFFYVAMVFASPSGKALEAANETVELSLIKQGECLEIQYMSLQKYNKNIENCGAIDREIADEQRRIKNRAFDSNRSLTLEEERRVEEFYGERRRLFNIVQENAISFLDWMRASPEEFFKQSENENDEFTR